MNLDGSSLQSVGTWLPPTSKSSHVRNNCCSTPMKKDLPPNDYGDDDQRNLGPEILAGLQVANGEYRRVGDG